MSEFKSFIQGHTAIKWWSQESAQVIDPKVIIYNSQSAVPCLKLEIKVNNKKPQRTQKMSSFFNDPFNVKKKLTQVEMNLLVNISFF